MKIKTEILFATLLALTVSGCGSDSTSSDESDNADYESNYESNFDDSYDEELIDDAGRPGTLKIDFEFRQSAEEEKQENDEHSIIKWDYQFAASYEQNVVLLEDLSAASVIAPNLAGQELLDAFERGAPYFELTTGTSPIVEGELKYNTHLYSKRPGTNGPEILDQRSHAEGSVDFFEISNFDHSKFGKGYEFDLDLAAKLTVTEIDNSNLYGNEPSEVIENDVNHAIEFSFYPKTDKSVFDRYPFEFEYQGLDKQTIELTKELKLEQFKSYQQLESKDVFALIDLFPGAVTEVTKDTLVIRYQHDGRPIIPRVGSVGLIQTSTNVLNITISISAD